VRAGLGLLLAGAAGAVGLGQRFEAADAWGPRAPREQVVEGTLREITRGPTGWHAELERVVGVLPPRPAPPPRLRVLGAASPPGVAPFEATQPGERVRARLRLRRPGGPRNPGGRDRERADRRAGVGAVARLVHPALHVRLPERDDRLRLAAWARVRARLGARLEAAGPGGALLRALALGDRATLAPALREACAALGVAHLLAVSGLHLGLVSALVYAAVRRAAGRSAVLAARFDTRGLALLAALVGALGYALLAGWGVAVRRALVLLLALGLGFARQRPAPRLQPLLLAAVLVLAFDPAALFSAGAQLSFAASAALLLAAPRAGSSRARRGALLRDGVRASATALAVTAPIAACQLGSRAPLALLANALAVPWTGAVLLPAALLAAAAAALPHPGADLAIAAAERLAAWSGHVVELAAGALPGAADRGAPAPGWLLAALLPALAALRARRTVVRVVWATAVSALLWWAPRAPLLPAPPRAVFLDVGQGDAALVQGRAAALLVDAGVAVPGGVDRGRTVVLPALRALGVRRLDALVASHADLDHRGGLPAVLAALPVGAVWLPRGARSDPGFAELLESARARGVPVRERGAGDAPSRLGDLRVTVLGPGRGGPRASRNDRSLVLRVEVGGVRVLLPGDLEAAAERTLLAGGAELRAEVLKLAHHGSRSSSTPAWLAAVDPELVVASAPCDGRFGMPHAEVRARVRRARAALWWTGRDGAVLVGLARPLAAWGWGPRRRCPGA